MIEYGYRKNEWVTIYYDDYGEVQVVPFDTLEQAENFIKCCDCKIGIVTTAFYNKVLANIDL